MKMRWLILPLAVALSIGCSVRNGGSSAGTPATVEEVWTTLPNAEGSLKFVVLGDWGSADGEELVLCRRDENTI